MAHTQLPGRCKSIRSEQNKYTTLFSLRQYHLMRFGLMPSDSPLIPLYSKFHASPEYYTLYYCNFPCTKKVWFPSYFLEKAQTAAKVHEKNHTKNSSFFGVSPLDFSVSPKITVPPTFT